VAAPAEDGATAWLEERTRRIPMISIRTPESAVARDAEELVRSCCPSFLANHSLRSYAWSVALGRRDAIVFDAELLFVAALFHDLGLLPQFDHGRCFEEDSAGAAAEFAAEKGWSPERTNLLADAVRLHNAVQIASADGPEAYLLWHATGVDVTGHRYGDVPAQVVKAVVAMYPRGSFKRGFIRLLRQQAERKPGCWAANVIRDGISDRILAAPFSS
jgi:hypothetical protein